MSADQPTPADFKKNKGSASRFSAVKITSDPFIGKIFGGRYRLNALIARGGMGSVYLARSTETGALYAIKILREEMLLIPKARARFFNESRAAQRIHHCSVARTYEVGETSDGIIYMVIEYVIGNPLRKLLRKGPLSPSRTSLIASAVAEGLAAAHEQNVIHRDLKPENIIIIQGKKADSVAKIIDFGIARIIDSPKITTALHVLGTPHYISPEQAMGGPVNAQTDVYSLGIIMYEMLCGAVPFYDKNPHMLLKKHIKARPARLNENISGRKISLKLEALVMSCLEKSPRMRPANMGDIIATLATLPSVSD